MQLECPNSQGRTWWWRWWWFDSYNNNNSITMNGWWLIRLSLSFYLSSSAVNVLSSEHDNHSWIKRKRALRPSIHWATARQAVSCLSEEFASSFWWTPSREWYPTQGNINKTCPLVKWLFVSLRISVLGQVRAISGSIGTSPFLSF